MIVVSLVLSISLLPSCQDESENPFKVAPDVGYPDTLLAFSGDSIDSIVPVLQSKGYAASFFYRHIAS